MEFQKPIKWISKHYEEWLRARPCFICGSAASEPHHIRKRSDGGTGLKPGSAWAVAVCRDCHSHLQRYDTEWELRGRVFKIAPDDPYVEAVKSMADYMAFLQELAQKLMRYTNANENATHYYMDALKAWEFVRLVAEWEGKL
jgi:hypothetical protein